MKNVLKLALVIMSFNYAMGNTYKHCQTLHGELEFIHPLKSSHLFIAPHSLSSNQRQIASLKALSKSDVAQWETLHFKSQKSENLWSQKNLNFKSDFKNYIEVSLNDGKTHTFSLSCTEF
jgi:hypothetical protein